jgi:hypothetical protein
MSDYNTLIFDRPAVVSSIFLSNIGEIFLVPAAVVVAVVLVLVDDDNYN